MAPRKAAPRPLATPRTSGELLSAEQAAARLGVRKATLYAYVSRGLLSAVTDAQQPRCSRYPAFEVDRLRQAARQVRRGDGDPQGTLFEGRPLVDTALTGAVDGQIVLRGRPLVDWSRSATLEDTAALLWGVPAEAAFGAAAPVLPELWQRTARALRGADTSTRMVTLWSLALPQLSGGVDLQGDALAAALGRHLRVAFACGLGQAPAATPLHRQLARAWRLPARHHDALRQALVLCADVMVNLEGLAGRMLASVEGSLGACVLGTLAYRFVRLSGGEFEAVEALFDELQAHERPAAVAATYRARGEALPGFQHFLFHEGDPRARALVELAAAAGSPAPGWVKALQGADPLHPTLDFGLVALRRAIGAPRHAALSLVHMARCTGALAQALEQRQHGRRMWVQSRYVGPLPAAEDFRSGAAPRSGVHRS